MLCLVGILSLFVPVPNHPLTVCDHNLAAVRLALSRPPPPDPEATVAEVARAVGRSRTAVQNTLASQSLFWAGKQKRCGWGDGGETGAVTRHAVRSSTGPESASTWWCGYTLAIVGLRSLVCVRRGARRVVVGVCAAVAARAARLMFGSLGYTYTSDVCECAMYILRGDRGEGTES